MERELRRERGREEEELTGGERKWRKERMKKRKRSLLQKEEGRMKKVEEINREGKKVEESKNGEERGRKA